MDTIDPNQTKNRCPTGLEREELIKWATRDREELHRISEEIKSNDHRIKDHTAAIHDYEEALNVTLSLRKGTETKAEANIKAYHLFSRHSESDVDNITSNVNEGTNKGTLTLLETLRIRDNTLAFNYKEKGDLESTLIHLKLRIERIESEIEATRSILTFIRSRNDTLAIQRNAIEIDLSKKLDLLSVRRYIPTEIWRDIFAFRVVDDERLFQLGGRIGLPPFTALRLSAVCQYWRGVAFNHQQLWEFIAIRNEFKARIEPRLKHYLSKLEDRLPLVYTYSNRPSRADWANVSALLSRYTPNCRSLDITVDVPQMMRRFFLPSLTVEMEELLLRKQLTDQEDIYVYKQLIQNTKSISCHKVQLCLENNFAVDPQFQPSDEDFLQLETLVFTDCNLEVDKLIRLCSEAPELSHLDIKGSNIDFGSSNDVPTGVTLQSLRKLSLQIMSEDAQAVVPSFEIRPTDEIDPNKRQNRCPIGIEREKLSQWAKRDQQELDRVSKEIKLNSEEIESCLLAICHYEEAILVAKLLRKCVEDKIQVAKKAFESICTSPEKHDQPPPLHDNRGTLALLNLLKMRNDTISAYNHEIKSLQSTIDHFAERTRNLEEDADATRSVLSVTRRRNETLELIKKTLTKDLSEKLELLSARRRTPDEIWRQIFLLRAVDDELDFELQERIGRPPFTSLRLSAVCQYWRRLVESQTDLWQCIALLNGNNTSSKPRLDHYLAKLGNRIPILYTYMLKKDVAPCWAELSTIISQKIPKCKSLDLAIDIPQPMPRSFLSSLKLTTEELRLRHHRPGQETIFVYKQRMKEVWSISCHQIQLRLERNFSPDTSEPSPAGQELALETLTFTECALELDPLFEFCRQAPRLHHLDSWGFQPQVAPSTS
ncbi:hypothetical protein FRB91_010835 [Serendipita sp. 411]|nr:hypothetical protein FRB91_010835 [Serendipita sp. 411]